MRKVCVYAICKNESANVERWLNSMADADYIVVLDTGSTDGTFEKLKNDHRVTRVEQKLFDPFRFDYARNASMELIPQDTEICVCTDFDETFEPGWYRALQDNWKDDTCRCLYHYHWSHNPDVVFSYDKIHSNNEYYWIGAVHEYLMRYDDTEQNCEYDRLHHIETDIQLHHWQDITKPRASYLDLLKLRVKENPNDAFGWWYLGREYVEHSYGYDGLECFKKALKVFENHPNMTDIFGMHMASLMSIGNWYRDNGYPGEALDYYQKAIRQEPMYREPYLYSALMCNQLGYYYEAIGFVNECLSKITNRIGHWVEEDVSWNERPYDILSVAYYNVGDIKRAKENVAKAHELNPFDERITKNYEAIMSQEG